MFNFVVYSSKLIRLLKANKIIVSQKEFVNNENYRRKILNEGKAINNPDINFWINLIEKESI